MSAAVTVIELAGLGVCAAAVALVTDSVPPEAQGWTVLGLLAVVVVGIGGALIKKVEASGEKTATAIEKSGERTAAAMDRNTEAQAKTATALALLVQESKEARAEGAQKRAEILAKLDQVQAKVNHA